MTDVFADTSALATGVFGTGPQRKAVADAFSDGRVLTCRYVVEELKCLHLHDLVRLHKLLTDSRSTGEAVRRAAGSFFTARDKSRLLQVLATLLDANGSLVDREAGIRRCRLLIEGELMAELLEPIASDGVLDDTGCARSGEAPRRDGTIYIYQPRCRASDPPQCRVMEFYERRVEEMRAIAEHLPDEDDRWQAVRTTLAEVSDGTAEGRGSTCYGILSDCIIAMSAPPRRIVNDSG